MTQKLSQQLEKVIQKASKIIKKSIKIDQKSIQNEVWDRSGSVPGPKSIPRGLQRRCNHDFGLHFGGQNRLENNQKCNQILDQISESIFDGF